MGEWYEIPNTSISSVDPSPPVGAGRAASKIDNWTSFVVDTATSKVYSVAGGGHGDYAGNEVDALSLATETPAWTEVLAPTPTASVLDAEYYSDGRPTSRHHYYGLTFDQFNSRFMMFSGSRWRTGWFTNKVDSYNIASNTYSPAGTHPNIPSPLAGYITGDGWLPSITLNPATGDVYLAVKFNSAVWVRSTNSWTSLGTGAPGGYYAMSAFDTARNRLLVLSNTDHHLYTLGSAWSAVTIGGANAADVQVQAASMFYVPALDVFLVRKAGAGGAVYQVNAQTFEATAFSTTGGASIPSTPNGPFNKFLYVPNLQGAVYVPTYGGNAWFLRIH